MGLGPFQGEGFLYMAYASAAVYDAVVAIEGGYKPYGRNRRAPQRGGRRGRCRGRLPDALGLLPARIVQPRLAAGGTRSAWECVPRLDVFYTEALARSRRACEDRRADSRAEGRRRHRRPRSGDNRMTPIGVTSVPDAAAGPRRLAADAAVRRAAGRRGWGTCADSCRRGSTSSCPTRRRRFRATSGPRRSTRSRPTARRPAASQRRADRDREVLVGERDPPVQPGRARPRRRGGPACSRQHGYWRWSTSSAPMR